MGQPVNLPDPLEIVIDFGNYDVKFMKKGQYGKSERVFRQLVQPLSEADYQMLSANYTATAFQGSALVKKDGRHYITGNQARADSLLGPAKYKEGHLDILLCTVLQQIHPDSHPNVHVITLHPPRTSGKNLQQLASVLSKRHEIEIPVPNSKKTRSVTYVVRRVATTPEPTAGFQDFVLNQDGRIYAWSSEYLQPGMKYLVIDPGGGETGFIPVQIGGTQGKPTFQLDLNNSKSRPVGIHHVLDTFQQDLRARFDSLSDVNEIDHDMMVRALMNGRKIKISGQWEECPQQIENALSVLGSEIRMTYNNDYGRGRGYDGIVITGGGGGITFEYLKNHVLDHNHVAPVEEPLDMLRFANIRGASKGYQSPK